MPINEPTTLTLKGDTLVAEHQGGVQGAGPQSQPRPFPEDALIWRPDVLSKFATEVLDIIAAAALKRAQREINEDDFMPQKGHIAPDNFRRRTVSITDWPLEGILGKTGKTNWKNMVNGAVIGAMRKIELDQHNGTWSLEKYAIDMDTRGSSDVIVMTLTYVDLSNSDDMEWEDGAPRKASKPTVQVVVQQNADGRMEASTANPGRKPGGLRQRIPPPPQE